MSDDLSVRIILDDESNGGGQSGASSPPPSGVGAPPPPPPPAPVTPLPPPPPDKLPLPPEGESRFYQRYPWMASKSPPGEPETPLPEVPQEEPSPPEKAPSRLYQRYPWLAPTIPPAPKEEPPPPSEEPLPEPPASNPPSPPEKGASKFYARYPWLDPQNKPPEAPQPPPPPPETVGGSPEYLAKGEEKWKARYGSMTPGDVNRYSLDKGEEPPPGGVGKYPPPPTKPPGPPELPEPSFGDEFKDFFKNFVGRQGVNTAATIVGTATGAATGSATLGVGAAGATELGGAALLAAGPEGLLIAGIVTAGTALTESFLALDRVAKGLTQELAQISGGVAAAEGAREVKLIERQIQKGEQLGPALGAYLGARTELEVTIDKIAGNLEDAFLPALTEIIKILNLLMTVYEKGTELLAGKGEIIGDFIMGRGFQGTLKLLGIIATNTEKESKVEDFEQALKDFLDPNKVAAGGAFHLFPNAKPIPGKKGGKKRGVF